MKNSLLIIFLSMGFYNAFGQTYATDFTANDCDGNSHNLFSELDSGKVIVIAWVMPCAPCASIALTAYTSALSYENSHPGKVLFYMADDFADTDCSTLTSWAITNQMTDCTFFSDAALDMFDYGTPGMPKIIVLGGDDHKVYFNENSSSQGISNTIDQALGISNAINEKVNIIEKIIPFPNPAKKTLNLSYSLKETSNISIEVLDITGSDVIQIKNERQRSSGAQISYIDISNLSKGNYIIKLKAGLETKASKFTIIE